MTSLELRRDVVILACAISAGIHGALAPAHFDEGLGPGLGFVVATGLLGVLAVWLTLRPASALALGGATAVLFGLVAAYLLASTSGIPVLHPSPEPIDGLGLFTKATEAGGLLAALDLQRRARPRVASNLQPKGTLT